MSCISSARRTEIEARIAKLQEQLASANTALDSLAEKEIEMYKFDSNEGSQQTKRRKIEELTKLIEWLESRIDWYRRQLECGGGLVAINARRI